MTLFGLEAKTAREARHEISARWPHLDVNYKGYDDNNECVIMSLVRKQGDKATVATAKRNRSKKATSFTAELCCLYHGTGGDHTRSCGGDVHDKAKL